MTNSEEPVDDIVFAKFINYMKKALLHKKMNYIRDNKWINEKECSIEKIKDLMYSENEEHLDLLEKVLNQKEKIVLELHILEKRTYNEIAKKLKVKPESVRKIKYRAIKKIIKWRKDNENRIS
mgnify:CR=1 FL=1